MKIASKIKPRNGKSRTVTIHGRPYVFAAEQDKGGETHFVADVRDDTHAELLLSHEAFYAFGPNLQKTATLQRGKAAASAVAPAEPGVLPAAPTVADVAAAEHAKVQALLEGTLADIGKAVGTVDLATVRAAIVMESAAASPRKNVLKLLQDTLDGAKAAGVAD